MSDMEAKDHFNCKASVLENFDVLMDAMVENVTQSAELTALDAIQESNFTSYLAKCKFNQVFNDYAKKSLEVLTTLVHDLNDLDLLKADNPSRSLLKFPRPSK